MVIKWEPTRFEASWNGDKVGHIQKVEGEGVWQAYRSDHRGVDVLIGDFRSKKEAGEAVINGAAVDE